MYFAGTQMHMVTFCIVIFELVMLLFQVIFYLERKTDKNRLYYLLLLILLIAYNIIGGLLPDPNISMELKYQNTLAFFTGFIMSWYFVFYFYKGFDLPKLKTFVTKGALIYLVLPFIACFVCVYYITGNLALSRKLVVIVPFLYAIAFVIYTAKGLMEKLKNPGEQENKSNYIGAYIALLCWITLPVLVFLGDFQVLQHSVINAGFLVMTIIYVRTSVIKSQKEYARLIVSEKLLQENNADLHTKVNERTVALEKMHQQRTAMFINLAHETKTPLTLINNCIDRYNKNYEKNEEVDLIATYVEKLNRDIIEFFKVENYASDLINLSTMITGNTLLYKSLASVKNIELNGFVETDLIVKGSAIALDKIIYCLLEKLIELTNLYEANISISLLSQRDKVILTIAGKETIVTDKEKSKLHDTIYQDESKTSIDETISTLATVRKSLEEMNGTIQIESLPGLAFIIKLPGYSDKEGTLANFVNLNPYQVTSAVGDALGSKDKPYVFIVEDNVHMLQFLYDLLKPGHNVYTAINGIEAVKKLSTIDHLDLILSDVLMPGMDGYTLRRKISESEKFSHTPFIFLTAKATHSDKLNGFNLGALDYIEKPFMATELTAKIEAVLCFNQKQKAAILKEAYLTIQQTKLPNQEPTEASLHEFENKCKKFNLSPREIEVITLIAKAKTYREIGDQLNISEKTVRTHSTNIFAKVGVSSKMELINTLELSSADGK
jgi:DNA-binding NarL/FixJ family response regulator/signal transduction histidine kinase